jgi:predicted acyl esterase
MQRGYTFVMVDLRGYGGSTGCLDWVGPGEQADVAAAVTWAADQPWSTGRVGMYGKSYDGETGLVGVANRPRGLAAVVSGEPVYDGYRYLFSNGERFVNSLGTPALYDAIALTPGPLLDSPAYNLNGLTTPQCVLLNYLQQQNRDHGAAYWHDRDLIAKAKGSTVPLFLTQGFIEDNTKPDGAFDFFNELAGPKRAWFGMWDHVRGNDTNAAGRLLMGRPGWFDEVMRFYDHYVRQVPLTDAPTDKDPPVAVQTSDGTWRSETAWPPVDARAVTVPLQSGKYSDDAQNVGSGLGGSPNGLGIWTISPPLAHDAHLAGVPHIDATVDPGAVNANFTADVYDISPDSKAILISRGTSLVPTSAHVSFDMYGDDWLLPAGHRVGVLVGSANSEWWLPIPTLKNVQVSNATITLPFLGYTRPDHIAGARSVKLESYIAGAPFAVPADTLAAGTVPGFPLPPALVAAPKPKTTVKPASVSSKRLVARISAGRHRVVVYGNAPSGARLTIKLLRGKRAVATGHVVARYRAFGTTFTQRRGGRYYAVVSAKVKGRALRSRSRTVSVRGS